jgi:hypothetical protein
MATINLHDFTFGAPINKPQYGLETNELRRQVPSAFAPSKHDSRSDRYSYIPTSAVIEGLIANNFHPFSAKQGGSRIEGKSDFTKHMIRFRQTDSDKGLTVGGNFPEIVLINSHDGTSAYKLMAGFFRLVCSNGLIVADSVVGEISIQHKGDVVANVIDASLKIIENMPKAVRQIEAWSSVELTPAEQNIFAEQAHRYRFADADGQVTTPIEPKQLLDVRRRGDAGNDLYSTFNRIQEATVRGGLTAYEPLTPGMRRRPRRVTTREVRGIDGDKKLNQALWSMAEEMARLKGVAA